MYDRVGQHRKMGKLRKGRNYSIFEEVVFFLKLTKLKRTKLYFTLRIFSPEFCHIPTKSSMPFRKVSYKVHWLRNNHRPFRDQLNLKPISEVRIRQGCIPPTSQISYSHFLSYFSYSPATFF